ncbi:uncharacterized protein [Lolium perenne]|uniref:uncharacterized protein n=1 Tax=Lolium perenne TaxID=4522 RepID=UPI003A99AD4B
MLTSQGAEVRQPEATSERSSAEFCVHLRQRPRPPSGLKCLKHMLQVIAIKQLNRDGNQGNKEFLVVVLMWKRHWSSLKLLMERALVCSTEHICQGPRRRAQSRRYGRRCLAGVLGRELTAEYEIAAPSRRDGRVPPADEISAHPPSRREGRQSGEER